MSSSKNNEASARAAFAAAKVKQNEIQTVTEQHAQVIKKAPDYAKQPDVQKATATWESTAGTVANGLSLIQAAKLALVALIATQDKSVAAWRRATQMVIAAINQASGGSAEAIKLWGFAQVVTSVLPGTSDPPVGLTTGYDRHLALFFKWTAVRGQKGYLVQIGDGTPQGWGVPINVRKSRYSPTGLAPGQKIAVRVGVVRRNGPSQWSDAVTLTVR